MNSGLIYQLLTGLLLLGVGVMTLCAGLPTCGSVVIVIGILVLVKCGLNYEANSD
jgi:hypothetical protein